MGYGDGSLYQRKSDGLWVGIVEAGYTAKGTRRRVPVYAKTKTEAKRKRRDKERQINAQGAPAAVSARTTVKSWAEEWLELTRPNLRRGPWATNRSAVRQWIVPTIGHRRLEQLTPADIRAVAAASREAGRSSSTAARTHSTLTTLLRAAVLEGHPIPSRVFEVKAPTLAANDREPTEDEAALAILAQAGLLPHGSRWLYAVLYGPRQGECLGLTWDGVDFDRDLIRVEWQLQPQPYVDPRNKVLGFQIPDGLRVRHLVDAYHLTEVKTRKGTRVLPMVPMMKAALLAWRDIAPESPWGLVWPAADGRPANSKDDRAEWYAIQCTVGVGHPSGRWYYTHEARHGLASALLEHGEDPEIVTALMGHSSILSTRAYQHVRSPRMREAMERIEARYQLPPSQSSSSG